MDAAFRFDAAGDYLSARDQYWKALVNARDAGASWATISMLTYNFGRTAGYTCLLEPAEKHLLESVEMEKAVSGSGSANSAKRQFELARFYFDQGNYAKASDYYATGIPIVEKLGVRTSDPIALADALDEYSLALAKTGHAAESSAAIVSSAELRRSNAGRTADFKPVRYKCPR